jgi:hypothetical protein
VVDRECETMAPNPGFEADITGWRAPNSTVVLGWDPRDATGSDQSGSMLVNNMLSGKSDHITMDGAYQCFPVTSGGLYEIAADLFVPNGQEQGRGGISVLFFEKDDCADANEESFATPFVSGVDEWTHVGATFIVPANIRSMSVRLVAEKAFRPPSFRTLFDNVLIKAH